MKGEKQKIFERTKTYPQENRTESEGNEGGQTYIRMTENDATNNNRRTDYGMLEFIVSPSNPAISADLPYAGENQGVLNGWPAAVRARQRASG